MAEIAEVPDSQDVGEVGEDGEGAVRDDPGGTAGGRNSPNTFVTELTAEDGARRGGGGTGDRTAQHRAPPDRRRAQDWQVRPPPGASCRPPAEAAGPPPPPSAAAEAEARRARALGTPAPRAPLSQRAPSQPTPGGGSAVLSPTGTRSRRASQHIERCDRNMKEDPMIRKIRESGARPPPELQRFTGRIGSPTAVEAAFGGRFIDRQPQRWHRFEDHARPRGGLVRRLCLRRRERNLGPATGRRRRRRNAPGVDGAALVEEAAIRGARVEA